MKVYFVLSLLGVASKGQDVGDESEAETALPEAAAVNLNPDFLRNPEIDDPLKSVDLFAVHPPPKSQDQNRSIRHHTRPDSHSHIDEHHPHNHQDEFEFVVNGDQYHYHHHHSHSQLLRWFTAVQVIAFLLVISGFGISLPHLIRRTTQRLQPFNQDLRLLVESLCTAFAAGGFWGLALIHVLFESVSAMDRLDAGFHIGSSFMNAAYPLALVGYMLMLGVEAMPAIQQSKQKERHKHVKLHHEQSTAKTDAVVSCFALGFHAFFEGLVVGMRHDPMLMWIAAVSVGGHKWAEAFALSQRMLNKDVPDSFRRLLLGLFVATTPVGLISGALLGGHEESLLAGCINSVSCGVLIFVAGHCTSDVFGHGHDHSHDNHPDAHSHDHPHTHHRHSPVESTERQPLKQPVPIEDFSEADVSAGRNSEDKHETSCGYNEGPTRCRQLESSYLVFFGRFALMSLGASMVLGLMLVHLAAPGGHSH